MEQSQKRRLFLINQSFQYKYAATIMLLFSLSAFLVWWETYLGFQKLLNNGMLESHEVLNVLKQIGRITLFKFLVAQALVFLMSIFLSHFIVGPLYRLEKCLLLLKTGDLTHRMKIRKLDQLTDIADTYNTSISSLQSTIGQDREILTSIVNEMEEAISQKGSLDKKQTASITKRLRETTKGFTI